MSETERTMSLMTALRILAGVHTRDDSETGFAVIMGATPGPFHFTPVRGPNDYVEAWRVVRGAIDAA